jgi:hemerythrin-like domain-containing protein
MNVIKLIRKDHQTVKALFRKLEKTGSSAQKQEIAEEIIEELSVHALVEEQLVYPVLRARDSRLEESVLEALEEHHVAKLTLAELDKMKPDDERFEAKMHVLRESIEMHIEEEEEKLLPRLEQKLSSEELDQLGQTVMALKQAAPSHPHPLAPDTPPGGAVAGAFAKVTDAAKDLLHRLTNQPRAEGHKRVTRRAEAEAGNGNGNGNGRARSANGKSARGNGNGNGKSANGKSAKGNGASAKQATRRTAPGSRQSRAAAGRKQNSVKTAPRKKSASTTSRHA